MHRKEGLMFKNMGQTYTDMKKLHEEAAGMPLEDMFMDHIVKPFATRDALSHSLHRLNEDYESLKAENAELRGINQSLSVDWVKYNDMKACLEFFARLDHEMWAEDIRRVARVALGIFEKEGNNGVK